MTNYCLDVLNNRRDMRSINTTTLVLIPKVQNPTNIGQFHPISLCNVLLKIISKVVTNRIKKALQGCINETQGAFVPGRQITDNIFVAYELLHSFKKKRNKELETSP